LISIFGGEDFEDFEHLKGKKAKRAIDGGIHTGTSGSAGARTDDGQGVAAMALPRRKRQDERPWKRGGEPLKRRNGRAARILFWVKSELEPRACGV
jgi:hypothetical protein